MPPKSTMRRHARLPFKGAVQVSWKDDRGQVKSLRAQCLDLSAEGARLETDAPIAPRTSVTLNAARYGSLGTASVRYCERHTLRYAIGVEFTSALTLGNQARQRCLDDIPQPPKGSS